MNDLIIENKITNESNNRIFIFHNEENEINDKVEVLGLPKEYVEENAKNRIDIVHESYFNKYLNKRYLDNKQIQCYKNSSISTIFYTLTDEKNDIIICDKSDEDAKSALIIFPYKVDNIQLENLKKYGEYFKDFMLIYEEGLHLEKVSPTSNEYIIASDDEEVFSKNSFDIITSKAEKLITNKKK